MPQSGKVSPDLITIEMTLEFSVLRRRARNLCVLKCIAAATRLSWQGPPTTRTVGPILLQSYYLYKQINLQFQSNERRLWRRRKKWLSCFFFFYVAASWYCQHTSSSTQGYWCNQGMKKKHSDRVEMRWSGAKWVEIEGVCDGKLDHCVKDREAFMLKNGINRWTSCH